MRRKDREITSIEEILKILDQSKVCHLGFADNGQVYVLPMNFGYLYKNNQLFLYFHSAKEGRKLEILRANPEVGFAIDCGHQLITADTACAHGYYFSSIIGNGTAAFLESEQEKSMALNAIVQHQTGKQLPIHPEGMAQTAVFQIAVTQYSCKRHM